MTMRRRWGWILGSSLMLAAAAGGPSTALGQARSAADAPTAAQAALPRPAGGAAAAPGADTRPASRFAGLLPGLQWGASHEQVMAHYEQKIWKTFDERRRKMTDVLDIELGRRRTAVEVQTMRAQYVPLEAGSEAYRVSIIETEFQTGTGESIFRVDEADAQRYYFFIGDKLWKYIEAFSSPFVRDKPFNVFLEEMTARYGQPTSRRTEQRRVSGAGVEVLAELAWQDETFRVRAADQTPFFGTYTLILSGRALEDRIAELRGHAGQPPAATGDAVDPSMKPLLGEMTAVPGPSPDTDIVDQILGEETKVDVVKEMPVSEEDFQPALPASGAPPAGGGSDGGSTSAPAVDSKGPIIY